MNIECIVHIVFFFFTVITKLQVHHNIWCQYINVRVIHLSSKSNIIYFVVRCLFLTFSVIVWSNWGFNDEAQWSTANIEFWISEWERESTLLQSILFTLPECSQRDHLNVLRVNYTWRLNELCIEHYHSYLETFWNMLSMSGLFHDVFHLNCRRVFWISHCKVDGAGQLWGKNITT